MRERYVSVAFIFQKKQIIIEFYLKLWSSICEKRK